MANRTAFIVWRPTLAHSASRLSGLVRPASLATWTARSWRADWYAAAAAGSGFVAAASSRARTRAARIAAGSGPGPAGAWAPAALSPAILVWTFAISTPTR